MTTIQTQAAPEAVGPYAQAIEVNGMIFCSGQLPINPATGNLEAAGAGLGKVVKTTVFLTDIGDFPAVNKVYGDLFGNHTPARSTVQVARLPKCAKVEIEAIAVK